ncbi:MAG: hypothetical protein Q9164_006642 [Protoblastenia rupestris]
MDPASLSFAVVGMFLTCCKGYNILSDAYKAPSDAQDAARRIRIEGAALASWGAYFKIRQELREEQKSENLTFYIMQEHIRSGVFDALCAISETFTDVKKLDKKYGVVFDYHRRGDRSPRIPHDVQDLLDGRLPSRSPSPGQMEKEDEKMKRELRHFKVRMSLLERCRWSLRGKERIESLIKNLRRYNKDLLRLCSPEALAQINRGHPTFTVPQSSNFMELHVMANIAEEAATEDKASPMAEGRQLTATMARFKARVMTPLRVSNKHQHRWRLLDKNDYNVLSTSNAWSLGTSLRSEDPVFVEWRSFIGKKDRPNKLAEEQIHELGDFLTVPHRPKELRALDCVGLFQDKPNARYGIVHEIPEHLRNLRTESRRIYNPSTLTDLMHNVDNIIDLGVRFELAKKLIYSVVVLHTCGWLHKNITSDNIIFFTARPADGEKVKESRKDVGRPMIVGYGLSRPDDVATREAEERKNNYSAVDPIRARNRGGNNNEDEEQPDFNIYQHPDKSANPDRRFRHSYDIYSLGLVLLELGLWQSLQKLDSSQWKDAYAFRKFILDRLVPDLWGQCGSIYGNVIKECLTLDTGDLAVAEEGQRKLAWNIAEKLDRCVA